NGVVWFRRQAAIPAEWVGRELVVEFCPIDKQDITYINGEEIGHTGRGLDDSLWNQPRRYTVPARLVTGTTLTLAVRNYSFKYDAGFHGNPSSMRLFPADAADKSTAVALQGQWRYAVEFKTEKVTMGSNSIHGLGAPNRPTALFDNMIAPLIPGALRGVIYYQGESDERNSANYHRLMRDLVSDWRFRWGYDFPFIQVLLAGYGPECQFAGDRENWPYIREAQLAAAADTGNLVASAIDVGDVNDIHPLDKVTVGSRLAAAALVQTYGRPGPGTGPIFREATAGCDGRSMRLRFDHIGGGLCVKGEKLAGFYAAGEFSHFEPVLFQEAEARIVAPDTVEVRLPGRGCVSAVRYAWSDNPSAANLYNQDGFPAAPFRTDRGVRGGVAEAGCDTK
ncbi:MAG: sialate O-acetylesterase, partial [Victivallaceae bacterium]|nr:sialate O-acetylesterase [Victivallaceae bacterium]